MWLCIFFCIAVSISQLEITSSACKVLLKYLINCLQTYAKEANPNNTKIEKCIKAIKSLCVTNGLFTQVEVLALQNTMKTELVVENDPTSRFNEV